MNRHGSQTNLFERKRRWPRIMMLLLVYGCVLAAGHWGGEWLAGIVGENLSPEIQSHARHVIIAGVALCSVLMAIPFVPGMEISLALLAAFGEKVAVFVYAATVVALVASYLIGRLVSVRLIASIFDIFGQSRAREFVQNLEPLSPAQRLETLIAHAPERFIPTLLKHRYVAIVVALNLPGNAIIGGGGGIALLAGVSGLFTFPRYLTAVSLAVLPLPLAVVLVGN